MSAIRTRVVVTSASALALAAAALAIPPQPASGDLVGCASAKVPDATQIQPRRATIVYQYHDSCSLDAYTFVRYGVDEHGRGTNDTHRENVHTGDGYKTVKVELRDLRPDTRYTYAAGHEYLFRDYLTGFQTFKTPPQLADGIQLTLHARTSGISWEYKANGSAIGSNRFHVEYGMTNNFELTHRRPLSGGNLDPEQLWSQSGGVESINDHTAKLRYTGSILNSPLPSWYASDKFVLRGRLNNTASGTQYTKVIHFTAPGYDESGVFYPEQTVTVGEAR